MYFSTPFFRLKFELFLAVKESRDQNLRLKSQPNEQASGYKTDC